MTVHWPTSHRELYEREAARAGVSVNEYVIRKMAELHGLTETADEGTEPVQLRLGA